MAYSLRRGESIETAVPAMVRAQTNAALAVLLTADHAERNAVALDARKRCKKVRGLLRLVRGSLGDQYRPADHAYRSVGRALAARREAEANLATLDRLLVASPADLVPADGFRSIREELVRRATAVSENGASDPAATAARLLGELLDDVDSWTFSTDGWPALEGGFRRTYRQGVARLDNVLVQPTPEGFHDLRKRVKYTWYHLRLLKRAAPSVLVPLGDQFHRLAIGLGDAHDLAEFGGGTAHLARRVRGRAHRRSGDRGSSTSDGRWWKTAASVWRSVSMPNRLASIPTGSAGYWRSWQRYGDEQPLRTIRPPRARAGHSPSRTAL